ncbi:DUF2304 domain-containing protein [Saccharopolyspora rhizosphaerae]|uniref:DUF2304 domain-containing protein n=1 Tax=Saccharopolyspora rhizosphaerae TaxID=2492662 RepID=A0A426K0G5_9PSEU|nr:DUF2304 domain-containing protein [Saccharopolyspora rhizosphaerae]RRO18922.1 DUF2304 domain-containing protein [Saccharopolyspora rhizosphaerae]
MMIQVILVAAVAALLVFFLRHHGTTYVSAAVRIGFVMFLGFGVFAVLRPEALTALAASVGVGRGSDLLLYGLVTAFAFFSLNTYLRFKELRVRLSRLARAVALDEERERNP